jgi:glucan phosphorylase
VIAKSPPAATKADRVGLAKNPSVDDALEVIFATCLKHWTANEAASSTKLKALGEDREFRDRVNELAEGQRQILKSPAWFQHTHGNSPLTCAAYFSMEFGLGEALPIYSGGLGNVAGDQLKAASDHRRTYYWNRASLPARLFPPGHRG